ncbi:MAG TPA: LON peptidase substrate-binding domain-containing protein [Beijerinckiaceae bacterium]|nr:LON peptidase substrate-binding domain-containing protein [Beijerinckiaceae bacterium]
MSINHPYHEAGALPSLVSVFPLAGALLLPRGQLPLNVFEPRYIAMVDDSLRSNRLIGMIQPISETEAPQAIPKLAPIGCLGRITQFAESRDGRYVITLSGIARFRVSKEARVLTTYRQCEVDYTPFSQDLQPRNGEDEVDREGVLRALRAFAIATKLEIDWDGIDAAPNEALVNALAMMSPFGLREKQALLEAPDLRTRAEVLIAITEFELAGADQAPSSLQ